MGRSRTVPVLVPMFARGLGPRPARIRCSAGRAGPAGAASPGRNRARRPARSRCCVGRSRTVPVLVPMFARGLGPRPARIRCSAGRRAVLVLVPTFAREPDRRPARNPYSAGHSHTAQAPPPGPVPGPGRPGYSRTLQCRTDRERSPRSSAARSRAAPDLAGQDPPAREPAGQARIPGTRARPATAGRNLPARSQAAREPAVPGGIRPPLAAPDRTDHDRRTGQERSGAVPRTRPRVPPRYPMAVDRPHSRAPCPGPPFPVPAAPAGLAGRATMPARWRPTILRDRPDRGVPPTANGGADRLAAALAAVGPHRASRPPGAATGGSPSAGRAVPGDSPVAERLAAAVLTVVARSDRGGCATGPAACQRGGGGPGPRRSLGTQGRRGKPRRRGRCRAGCRHGQACRPDDSPGTSRCQHAQAFECRAAGPRVPG